MKTFIILALVFFIGNVNAQQMPQSGSIEITWDQLIDFIEIELDSSKKRQYLECAGIIAPGDSIVYDSIVYVPEFGGPGTGIHLVPSKMSRMWYLMSLSVDYSIAVNLPKEKRAEFIESKRVYKKRFQGMQQVPNAAGVSSPGGTSTIVPNQSGGGVVWP